MYTILLYFKFMKSKSTKHRCLQYLLIIIVIITIGLVLFFLSWNNNRQYLQENFSYEVNDILANHELFPRYLTNAWIPSENMATKISFYDEKNTNQILWNEYIVFKKNGDVLLSLYEALLPDITTLNEKKVFVTPNFSLSLKLLDKSHFAPKSGDQIQFFHNNCISLNSNLFCFPEESLPSTLTGAKIAIPNNSEFSELENRLAEIFGSKVFYNIGKRCYDYYDPKTIRWFGHIPQIQQIITTPQKNKSRIHGIYFSFKIFNKNSRLFLYCEIGIRTFSGLTTSICFFSSKISKNFFKSSIECHFLKSNT